MARVCQVTGKKTSTGNTRSHSRRSTNRKFYPNLQKLKVYNPKTGRIEKMLVSAKGLKTVLKDY